MKKNKKRERAHLAVVLDLSDNSHCELIVMATDPVAAGRSALQQRKELAEVDHDEDDGGWIVQGEDADSSCPEYTLDEVSGFAVITVFTTRELLSHVTHMKELDRSA